MSLQVWTLLHLVSLVPIILVLRRVLRDPDTDARVSRNYYAFCLIGIILWTALDLAMRNLPPDLVLAAKVLNRLAFVLVSFVALFFVTSSIYLTRPPTRLEALLISSPVLVIVGINFVDPFAVVLKPYGWEGDIADPVLRYGWLALTSAVVVYSFGRLSRLQGKMRASGTRRRLTFFMYSALLALIAGVFFYVLAQLVDIPSLSVIAVNFSLLLAYPAFAPGDGQFEDRSREVSVRPVGVAARR